MWTHRAWILSAVAVLVLLTIPTSSAAAGQITFSDGGYAAIDELRRAVEALQSHVLLLGLNQESSTSYIRWGRKSCEGSATVVYKGYAAGPRFNDETGSGSNYLCLHESPQWRRQRSVNDWTGNIYGVQYETWEGGSNAFSLSNNNGQDLAPHPGPCVMCNVPKRSTVVMIPARTECPAGWNKEYDGYVITSARSYTRSSYICWDEAPETAPGGRDVDQSVIYHTKVRCGTLPCSTYDGGRVLTCVVCSK